MMLKHNKKQNKMEECKTKQKPYSVTKIFNQSRKERKDKKKIVDLAYILFSCKINRPCAAAFRPAYICEFKKLARKKKKILFAKNSRAKSKR